MNSCATAGVTPMSRDQRKGRLSVQQRVVDDLCRAGAARACRARCSAPKYVQRRAVVDVLAPLERVDQRFFLRQVREHPQLDLRVVGRDQHEAGSAMNARRISRPRSVRIGNVLQVGIAAAQASGGGHRLVERRVDARGSRVDQLRQRVDVGALQLHQRAPFEDQPRQLVGERQVFEHVDGGRGHLRLARALAVGSCSLSNRITESCFGELMLNSSPASSKIFRAARRQLGVDALRLARERRQVDAHAMRLDVGQHRNERHLEVAKQRVHTASSRSSRAELLPQAATPDRRARPRSSAAPPPAAGAAQSPSGRCRRRPPAVSAL